jgi:7-cyano-7-deazaguanine synthase
MCGIVGGVIEEYTPRIAKSVVELARSARARGVDGFGLVAYHGGDGASYRFNGDEPEEMGSEIERIFHEFGTSDTPTPIFFLACARAQPLPEADSTALNMQPYIGERFILVHNGTISNDRELWDEIAPGEPHPGIDTMVISRLFDEQAKAGGPNFTVRDLDTSMIAGGFAFGVIDMKPPGDAPRWHQLAVLRNIKTLWWSAVHYQGVFFASEPEWLESSFKSARHKSNATLFEQEPYTMLSMDSGFRLMPKSLTSKVLGSTPELRDNLCVVLTSGGIDSITAAYVAAKIHGRTPILVTVPHGQLASGAECAAVHAIAAREGWQVVEVDLSWLGRLGNSPLTDPSIELPMGMRSVESTLCWTPARNLVMISAAASVAEAHGARWIYYGNNMEEEATGYGDNDLSFVIGLNHVLRLGTLRGVGIKRALARLMKPEILKIGEELGVPYDLTWSCDQALVRSWGEGREAYMPCGRCGCCTTRRYAFKRAGMEDPQVYASPVDDVYPWTDAKTYDMASLRARVADRRGT